MWAVYCADKYKTLDEYVIDMEKEYGLEVSRSWVWRFYDHYGLSWKKGSVVNDNKFAPNNILYYVTYVTTMEQIDSMMWPHLLFMDESHYNSKCLSFLLCPLFLSLMMIPFSAQFIFFLFVCLCAPLCFLCFE
jgi:hypothetical protein